MLRSAVYVLTIIWATLWNLSAWKKPPKWSPSVQAISRHQDHSLQCDLWGMFGLNCSNEPKAIKFYGIIYLESCENPLCVIFRWSFGHRKRWNHLWECLSKREITGTLILELCIEHGRNSKGNDHAMCVSTPKKSEAASGVCNSRVLSLSTNPLERKTLGATSVTTDVRPAKPRHELFSEAPERKRLHREVSFCWLQAFLR